MNTKIITEDREKKSDIRRTEISELVVQLRKYAREELFPPWQKKELFRQPNKPGITPIASFDKYKFPENIFYPFSYSFKTLITEIFITKANIFEKSWLILILFISVLIFGFFTFSFVDADSMGFVYYAAQKNPINSIYSPNEIVTIWDLLNLAGRLVIVITIFIWVMSQYWRWLNFVSRKSNIFWRFTTLFFFIGILIFIFYGTWSTQTINNVTEYALSKNNLLIRFWWFFLFGLFPLMSFSFWLFIDVSFWIVWFAVIMNGYLKTASNEISMRKIEKLLQSTYFFNGESKRFLDLNREEIKIIRDLTKINAQENNKRILPLTISLAFLALIVSSERVKNLIDYIIDSASNFFSEDLAIQEFFTVVVSAILIYFLVRWIWINWRDSIVQSYILQSCELIEYSKNIDTNDSLTIKKTEHQS